MSNWQEFFEKHRDYSVLASFYECKRDFSLEDLYQAFKARLREDVETECQHDPLKPGCTLEFHPNGLAVRCPKCSRMWAQV